MACSSWIRLIARYDPVTNQVDWLFGTGRVIANADASLLFTVNIGSNCDSCRPAAGGNGLAARWQRSVDCNRRRQRRIEIYAGWQAGSAFRPGWRRVSAAGSGEAQGTRTAEDGPQSGRNSGDAGWFTRK